MAVLRVQLFDTDSDGVITREELQTGMQKLGIALNDEEVTAMMLEADVNKDGRVSNSGCFAFILLWLCLPQVVLLRLATHAYS